MAENLFRFAFWLLMLLTILVFGRGIVHGQNSPVGVDVTPKVAVVNPYKETTFRFTWKIEPHKDNRRYALMYSCGSEIHSSQGLVNGDKHQRTSERFVNLTVVADCEFMACVVRLEDDKAKTFCNWAYVRTPREEQ